MIVEKQPSLRPSVIDRSIHSLKWNWHVLKRTVFNYVLPDTAQQIVLDNCTLLVKRNHLIFDNVANRQAALKALIELCATVDVFGGDGGGLVHQFWTPSNTIFFAFPANVRPTVEYLQSRNASYSKYKGALLISKAAHFLKFKEPSTTQAGDAQQIYKMLATGEMAPGWSSPGLGNTR